MLEPPLADEGLARGLDLLAGLCRDHVGVVGGDLLMEPFGCVRQQVPVLVDRATLHRHAIPHRGDGLVEPRRAVDDEELRIPQAALDEIVENGAPSLGALAAHALDGEKHLLAVVTHAKDDQQRDRGRFAIEPYPHHRAVEDEADDWLLGQRAAFQASQSLFTLRHVRLTVSLPTVPPNSAASARRTRRVLVPARYVLAINASAASVRR